MALICDECGAEQVEIGLLGYRPRGRSLAGRLAEHTAQELGLAERQIDRVRLAAMVCDAGRDQIPPEILNKRGRLTAAEWIEVRRQPEVGAALLSDATFDEIREWILSRRERIDGTGYPRGLSGEQIPLEARILAVAEAYVAMRSERPHSPARDHDDAVLELLRCAGTQFDSAVVQAFVRAGAPETTPVLPTAA
jgi:HD-GYP domain-containing protein (c-di-GMP phosphodiesterase class II)